MGCGGEMRMGCGGEDEDGVWRCGMRGRRVVFLAGYSSLMAYSDYTSFIH